MPATDRRSGDHRLGARRRPVDTTDIRLLECLAADGRATFADLAGVAQMSHAATRERVLALMAAGVVTVQTIVSPGVLGIRGYAGLMIDVKGPARPVAEEIAAMPDTTMVATVLGHCDVLVEASYRDEAHLAELLDRVRSTGRRAPGRGVRVPGGGQGVDDRGPQLAGL